MPVGRALLYAEPIFLQADRSPMPELRVVVLAVQDRLAYGPTFDAALGALFGSAASALTSSGGAISGVAAASPAERGAGAGARADQRTEPAGDKGDALIAEAARSLADYQRLTAEGKLAEAGQKLEQLKRALDELQRRQP
jgi:uncharacterized membrane protein (UPF0182 family)